MIVIYNNKKYSDLNNMKSFELLDNRFFVENENELIESNIVFEENNEKLVIDFWGLFFKDNESDFFDKIKYRTITIFKDNYNIVIDFNCIDSKISDKLSIYECLKISNKNKLINIIDFIILFNKNINSFFNENPNKLKLCCEKYDTKFINIYNLLIFNTLEFEKVINSKNEKLIFSNINKENYNFFDESENGKLHKLIGLPKFSIKMIKEAKLEKFTNNLQELSNLIDGNDFKIFLNFIINSKLINNNSDNKMEEFINNIIKIIPKYKMNDLLNYLLKQSYYFDVNNKFNFPFNECILLKDYINMCEQNDLLYNKFPSFLKKTHDIVTENISDINKYNQDIIDKFEEAVICYEDVERTISVTINKEKKSYIFTVPKKFKDLLNEGNALHHCVGSYGYNIIDDKAHIVFMRDAYDPNKSFITINISKNYLKENNKYEYKLLEAKKYGDKEIENEYLYIINKWLKELNS